LKLLSKEDIGTDEFIKTVEKFYRQIPDKIKLFQSTLNILKALSEKISNSKDCEQENRLIEFENSRKRVLNLYTQTSNIAHGSYEETIMYLFQFHQKQVHIIDYKFCYSQLFEVLLFSVDIINYVFKVDCSINCDLEHIMSKIDN
jgi:hypothetical protein